jgi:hypothetical protein
VLQLRRATVLSWSNYVALGDSLTGQQVAARGVLGLDAWSIPAAATILARHGDWPGAAAVTGSTGLLVSPISWAHHAERHVVGHRLDRPA